MLRETTQETRRLHGRHWLQFVKRKRRTHLTKGARQLLKQPTLLLKIKNIKQTSAVDFLDEITKTECFQICILVGLDTSPPVWSLQMGTYHW